MIIDEDKYKELLLKNCSNCKDKKDNCLCDKLISDIKENQTDIEVNKC